MRTAIVRGAHYKWWAFGAIGAGTFTSVVDHGSVIVALPTIAEHFHTDLPTLQWVVVGYGLTISALLLPIGRLSDIVGRKQVYLSGFAVFILGAVLAGTSTSVVTLILARVLQGCGAAMTQGTAMAMIVSIFPAGERGKALGAHLSVVGAGAIAGPALGGILVGGLGWEWVFFFQAPASGLAIAAGLLLLEGSRFAQDGQRPRFDWQGAALSAASLITLLLALTMGHRAGWASAPILGAMLGSVALLAAFIWWELRAAAPMLELRLFTVRTFSLGVLASFISFLGTTSVSFLMPLYLQSVLGYSPMKTGLILIPNAVAMIVFGPLSGQLSDRYGARIFNVGGMAASAAGLFLLAGITESSALGTVMGAMILQSCGVAIFNSPNNSSIFAAVEQQRYGVVSALLTLVRNSGNVVGVAVATAIVTATMASMGYVPSLAAVSGEGGEGVFGAFTSGLRTAFLTMGGLLVVGIVLSFLRGGAARETAAGRAEERRAGQVPGSD